jgi:hypothetical protein
MTLLESPPIPYQGRADHVWPPFSVGWAEVPFDHDGKAVEHARLMLGRLPPYHYKDAALSGGLYRFFAFETPIGVSVSALKFVGEDRARALLLGQGSPSAVAEWIDNNPTTEGAVVESGGLAIPEDNSAVTGDGTGNAGVTVTPVAYPNVQAAATAMNNALLAHGYVRTDQPIYAGFQLEAGGITVDAFPGTNTMGLLKQVLAGMNVTMANVPIYPWLATTSDNKTGIAAYDGVNAPTWAQWTGQGTGAPSNTPVAAASAAGGGGALAALLALVVGGGAIVAKSAGMI